MVQAVVSELESVFAPFVVQLPAPAQTDPLLTSAKANALKDIPKQS